MCSNNMNSCNNPNISTGNMGIAENNANRDNITNSNLQANIRNYIGRRVTVELNINGTSYKKTGILTCVGIDFLTLKGLNNNNCLLVDTTNLNFITIHNYTCFT